jgi:pyruvate/2-oxoacid:ferredoxin oxidoreductase beta subunit
MSSKTQYKEALSRAQEAVRKENQKFLLLQKKFQTLSGEYMDEVKKVKHLEKALGERTEQLKALVSKKWWQFWK